MWHERFADRDCRGAAARRCSGTGHRYSFPAASARGVLVRLRIDGHLYDVLLLTTHEGTHAIRHFKAIAGMDSSQHCTPADARMTTRLDGREINLRVASAPCIGGEALTLRLLDPWRAGQRLGQLGLSQTNQTDGRVRGLAIRRRGPGADSISCGRTDNPRPACRSRVFHTGG